MKTIEVYNFLDGKNLCNILANLIVNKIDNLFPNAITEITVVNVGNFFVIKGKTSSDTLINVSEMFQDFLKKYDDELSKKVRIIDTIIYNYKFIKPPLNINFERDYVGDRTIKNIQSILNNSAKNKIYFNVKIEESEKFVYYDCDEKQLSLVKPILEKHFKNYKYIKSDFSNEIFISDKIYGLSNHFDKLYYLNLENISNHLFRLGISRKLQISLFTEVSYKEIDENNIFLDIKNDDHIVKTSWLHSLILDIFPFGYEKLTDKFKDSLDLIEFIIDGNEKNFSFGKLSEKSEIVLI